MKRPTPKNTGIIFLYLVPFSMKIDDGDEKLFMDSLPRLLHVSSQFLLDSQGCVHELVTSLLRVYFSAGEAMALMSFPAT